jgi:hypothetical protein
MGSQEHFARAWKLRMRSGAVTGDAEESAFTQAMTVLEHADMEPVDMPVSVAWLCTAAGDAIGMEPVHPIYLHIMTIVASMMTFAQTKLTERWTEPSCAIWALTVLGKSSKKSQMFRELDKDIP